MLDDDFGQTTDALSRLEKKHSWRELPFIRPYVDSVNSWPIGNQIDTVSSIRRLGERTGCERRNALRGIIRSATGLEYIILQPVLRPCFGFGWSFHRKKGTGWFWQESFGKHFCWMVSATVASPSSDGQLLNYRPGVNVPLAMAANPACVWMQLQKQKQKKRKGNCYRMLHVACELSWGGEKLLQLLCAGFAVVAFRRKTTQWR